MIERIIDFLLSLFKKAVKQISRGRGEEPGERGERPGEIGEKPGEIGERPGESGERPGEGGESPVVTVDETDKKIEEEAREEIKEEKTRYDWSDLEPLSIESEMLVQVPWTKYYREEFEKRQIALHHTVSGPGIEGDLSTWRNFSSHIATCVIIERDGTICQLFSSKYWGYHLGSGRPALDRHSIGIELDNWGQLTEKEGQLYTVYNTRVNVPVVHYTNFRSQQIFEAYTYEQLKSLGKLMLLWNKTYRIPLKYSAEMWDVSERALAGEPGVWTHVSYRPYPQKFDCHPDPNLISLLQALEKKA